ncbi:MAG TPA: LacI family DNA-binding transcriptional regulator [bacterium]|nr:LacI family DNA-binding transcriptional regulator [bacterium]
MILAKEKVKRRWPTITIADVAAKAGVSKATVSLVLNDKSSPIKISENTRQRVLATAKELKYSPNRLAKAFSTSRSNILGIVTSSAYDLFKSEYSARALKAIAQAAHDKKHNIMIFDDEIVSKTDPHSCYAALIATHYIDGLIFLVPDKPNPPMALRTKELKVSGMPHVFLWRRPPEAEGTTIQVNNTLGVQLATNYLLSLGHRRIAVVTHGSESSSSNERLYAFQQVLRDHGVEYRQDLVWHDELHPADDHRIVDEILALPQRPTAIFSFYDPIALNIINILTNKQVKVPNDISVMGFGDLYSEALTRPSLTSVREPVEQIGKNAVTTLLQQLNRPDTVCPEMELTIDPSLVIRGSCGPSSD